MNQFGNEKTHEHFARRTFLRSGIAAGTAGLRLATGTAEAQGDHPYGDPQKPALPPGMSANLCTEAHLRHLLEQGFEVAVVRDATAAARLPEGDGYLAAIINFRDMANALWTTAEAVAHITA